MAAYEFTTLTCIPGVVHYRGAKIQMLDLPGIIEGAKDGKGRGRQVWLLKTISIVPVYILQVCQLMLGVLSLMLHLKCSDTLWVIEGLIGDHA